MIEGYFSEKIIVIRLVMAVVFGLLIGIERERRKVEKGSKGAAGLRTHALVALGSALITVVGIYSFSADQARLAASIMTGIGFIGAGTIIASQGRIRGLTTAASIWISAAIGIAAGAGFYITAFVTTVLALFILELWRIEKRAEE